MSEVDEIVDAAQRITNYLIAENKRLREQFELLQSQAGMLQRKYEAECSERKAESEPERMRAALCKVRDSLVQWLNDSGSEAPSDEVLHYWLAQVRRGL